MDVPSWSFDDCVSLSRVELPDTLTTVHSYAFRGCALERIGIPESVTYVDIFAFDNSFSPTNPSCPNRNMKIYAVPGSAAQKYAEWNDVPWVAASQVFSPDGLTCMVTEEELPYYLANNWFPYPVATVYSPSGSAILIAESELPAYEATGWSKDKYAYYTPMYALDGRIVDILNSQVEAYKAVGWYDHTGYVCTKADQTVGEYGYASAVSYVETILGLTDQADPSYWTFYAKRNDLCAQWRQAIGSPIAVLGYSISHNVIGVPVVNMTLRNLTPAACGSLEVKFTCVDAYGNVTTDYPWLYDGTFTGYDDTANIPAYGTKTFAWTLYSNERTSSIRNPYALRAVFADGSVWGR